MQNLYIYAELLPRDRYRSGSNQYGVRLSRFWKIFYTTAIPGNPYVAWFLLNSTISQEVVGKD
ncbi:hypothetical protein QUB30_09595 [Microcoleus sp. BROC3]